MRTGKCTYQKNASTKKKIMLSAVSLLKEREVGEISIADIAKGAKVAVGLINYHFKSKEDLFHLSVEYYIRTTIKEESQAVASLHLPPKEQLIASVKGYADFLERHERLSKYYILYHLQNAIDVDSSDLGYAYYMPLLKQLKKESTDEERILCVYQIIYPVQMLFMRNESMKKATGLDFSCKRDRDRMVEKLVSNSIDKR